LTVYQSEFSDLFQFFILITLTIHPYFGMNVSDQLNIVFISS